MSAGLYLHYPYCKKRCLYCDFVSTTDLTKRKGYFSLLLKEKHLYQEEWTKEIFNTLYFGGGTPSLLLSDEWDLLSQWKLKELPDIAEFTVEANPESIDPQFISDVEKSGCNRISIGIQSMDDQVLSLIGRVHNNKQAIEAVELAKTSRIKQVSLDFIVGLPSESWDGIEKNCEFIKTYHPDHLSLYFLSLSPSSALFQMHQTNPSLLPEEKIVLEWWEYYLSFLKQLGYRHYEISNFSLPGCESMHNQHYWDRDPYLGLGVNASSFYRDRRWANEPNFETYQQKVLQDEKPVYFQEVLTEDTVTFEKIMLGLRCFTIGISEKIISSEKTDLIYEMLCQDWLTREDSRLFLTEKGCLWLDTIVKKLA